jgi:hypothetical protein
MIPEAFGVSDTILKLCVRPNVQAEIAHSIISRTVKLTEPEVMDTSPKYMTKKSAIVCHQNCEHSILKTVS